MKKNSSIIIVILFWLLISDCYAFSLFGGVKNEIKSLKDSEEKHFSDIKAGINDVQIKLQQTINAQATLDAKVVGYDKSVRARDITTTTTVTNDPKIWQGFAGILSAIVMFLLRDCRATRKWLMNALASKQREETRGDTYKQKYMELLQEKNGREK